jgi:energy-coupling factor transporter ATP-binding protein EcfA2
MPDYDFSTLNSSDLEELSCDLMNMSQKPDSIIKYKTFKDGQDKGIDFLYSSEYNEYDHVGQVKHFYRTGYSGMLTKLKSDEVDKVKKLKPNKYYFFTSVDLSVAQTEELKLIFTPFIKKLNDIYGKKDINKLIADNPKILDLHFKLWLSDFEILKKILASDLEFRSSDFIENELKKRLRLFVKTSLLEAAKESLENNKFVIITGEPGVGKTTLAEILTYEYIAKDYTLSYVLDDIKEVEEVLTPDSSKQIIYFDDFLGSNSEEINKSKGSESRLIKILKRISKLENKLLILTTRTFILKTVIEESERLKRYGLISKTNLLELSEYDTELKKEMFQNHIEEADIESEFKEVLIQENLRDFIVNHKNFTPRSVEFITSQFAIERNSIEGYENFIRENFNYPDEIWRHAYTYQIKEDDQLLLSTLFSFSNAPTINDLEGAFMSRVNYEILTNNKSKEINAFKKALNRIDGGLIITKKNKVNFINPSIKDFLIKFLKEDKDEMDRIVNSIVFITQFSEQLFEAVDYTPNIPEELQNKLIEDYESFIRQTYSHRDSDLIQLAIVIKKYLGSKKADDVIIEIINEIDDWHSLHSNYELNIQFGKFLREIGSDYHIMKAIESSASEIVNDLVLGESDIEKSINILSELKTTFQLDFLTGNFKDINNHFDQLFSDLIYSEVEWLKDFANDESYVYEKKQEIENLVSQLNNLDFEYSPDLSEFNLDWDEITRENEFRRLMEKDD